MAYTEAMKGNFKFNPPIYSNVVGRAWFLWHEGQDMRAVRA